MREQLHSAIPETWTLTYRIWRTLLWWRNGIARWWSDNFRWWNGNFRWWNARHRLRNAVPARSGWIWPLGHCHWPGSICGTRAFSTAAPSRMCALSLPGHIDVLRYEFIVTNFWSPLKQIKYVQKFVLLSSKCFLCSLCPDPLGRSRLRSPCP